MLIPSHPPIPASHCLPCNNLIHCAGRKTCTPIPSQPSNVHIFHIPISMSTKLESTTPRKQPFITTFPLELHLQHAWKTCGQNDISLLHAVEKTFFESDSLNYYETCNVSSHCIAHELVLMYRMQTENQNHSCLSLFLFTLLHPCHPFTHPHGTTPLSPSPSITYPTVWPSLHLNFHLTSLCLLPPKSRFPFIRLPLYFT